MDHIERTRQQQSWLTPLSSALIPEALDGIGEKSITLLHLPFMSGDRSWRSWVRSLYLTWFMSPQHTSFLRTHVGVYMMHRWRLSRNMSLRVSYPFSLAAWYIFSLIQVTLFSHSLLYSSSEMIRHIGRQFSIPHGHRLHWPTSGEGGGTKFFGISSSPLLDVHWIIYVGEQA